MLPDAELPDLLLEIARRTNFLNPRRQSPLTSEHITLVGRYHIALAEAILSGDYRSLKAIGLTGAAHA
jgi:hypothetical protein